MENAIDDLLKPINANFINLDDFFILFQTPISKNFEKKKRNSNITKDNFVNSLIRNNDKRLKLSQRTNKNKTDEETDEILNTINSKFDTIPYYETFRYK